MREKSNEKLINQNRCKANQCLENESEKFSAKALENNIDVF